MSANQNSIYRKTRDRLLEMLQMDEEENRRRQETQVEDPLMWLQRAASAKAGTKEDEAQTALKTAEEKRNKFGEQGAYRWQPTTKNSVPLYGADRQKKLPSKMSLADRIMMSKLPGAPGHEEEFRLSQMSDRELNTLAAEKTKRNGAAVSPGSQIVGISRAGERNIPLRYVDEKTTGWLDRPWYYVPVDENGNPQQSGGKLVLKNDGADLASQAATEDWWRRNGTPAMENGSPAWARQETIQKNLLRYGRNWQAGQTGEQGYREEKALEWYLGTEQGKRDAQQAGSVDAVRGAFKTNSTYRNGIVNQWSENQKEAGRTEAREGTWREAIRADVDQESMQLLHLVEDQMTPEDVNLYRYIMDNGVNYDSAYDPEQTLAGMDDEEKASFLESFRDDMTDILEAQGYEPKTVMTGVNAQSKEAAKAEGKRADLVRAENWKGYSIQLMGDIIDMAKSGKTTDALMGWNQAMRDNQRRLDELYGLKASGSNAHTGYWADDRNATDDVQNQIDILNNENEILVLGSVVFNPDFKQRSQPIEEYARSSATYALIAGLESENTALTSEDETGNNWQVTVGGVDANTIRANMEPWQRDTYLYLYNNPEYGPEQAGVFLESVGRSLQYTAWKKEEQKESQWAQEHPLLAFAQDILTLPKQGFESAIYNITNMFYSQSPYDESLYATRGKETHRAVTDDMFGDFVGRELVNWWQNYVTAQIGAGQTSMHYTPGQIYRMSEEDADKLYEVGRNAAIKSKNAVEQGLDSAYLMLLSYGVSGAMGWGLEKMGLTAVVPKERLISTLTSIAIQSTVLTQASTGAALTTAHAKELGVSDTGSMIKGLSSGFAEWLTETLGAEWLFKSNFVSQAMVNNGHYMAGLMFLSSAAEAMEEVFSLGLDTTVEAFLNGARSEVEARRDAYEAEHPGCSEVEKTFGAGVSLAADALEQAASVFFTTGPSTAMFSAGYRARSGLTASSRAQELVNQGLITQEQKSDAAATMQRGWAVETRMQQAAENGLTYTPTVQDVQAMQAKQRLDDMIEENAIDKAAGQAFAEMVTDGMGVEENAADRQELAGVQDMPVGNIVWNRGENGTYTDETGHVWVPAVNERGEAILDDQGKQALMLTQEDGSPATDSMGEKILRDQAGMPVFRENEEEKAGTEAQAQREQEDKGKDDQRLTEIRKQRAQNQENLEKAKRERETAQRKLEQKQNAQGESMKAGDRVLLTNESEQKIKADISRLDNLVRQIEQKDQILAREEETRLQELERERQNEGKTERREGLPIDRKAEEDIARINAQLEQEQGQQRTEDSGRQKLQARQAEIENELQQVGEKLAQNSREMLEAQAVIATTEDITSAEVTDASKASMRLMEEEQKLKQRQAALEQEREQLAQELAQPVQQAAEELQEQTREAAEAQQQPAETERSDGKAETDEGTEKRTLPTFTEEEVKNVFRILNNRRTLTEMTNEQKMELMDRWASYHDIVGHRVLEAGAKVDGHTAKVVGLDSVGEDAKVIVEQEGQRSAVPLDDVEFNNRNQKEVYVFARGMKDLTAGKLVLGAWEKSKLPFVMFRRAFSDVYTAARTGVALTQVQKIGANMLGQALVDRIKYVGHQAMQAESDAFLGSSKAELDSYLTQIRNRDTEAKGYKGVALGRTVHLENLSADQKVAIQMLDFLGREMGLRIVVTPHIQTKQEQMRVEDAETKQVPNSGTINGLFLEGTNTIVVALDSLQGAIVHHAGHESWHYVKDQARRQGGKIAQEVRAFGEDVLRLMQERDSTYNLEERIAEKIEQYKQQGVKIKREGAIEELQAEAIMVLMNDMMGMQAMQEANPTILKKIVDGLKHWLRKLKNAIANIGRYTPEVSAMLQVPEKEIRALTQRYSDMIKRIGQSQVLDASKQSRVYSLSQESAEQLQELGMEAPEQAVYSLAGEHAQGQYADIVRRANEMARQGKTDEEIRKATGAVKGYNGRWWAIIDNSDMRFEPDPVMEQIIFTSIYSGKDLTTNLGSIYKAADLYKAYPELKGLEVRFVDLEDEDAIGMADRENGKNILLLNRTMLNKMDNAGEDLQTVIEETLQHEVQHVIQRYEGSNTGASTYIWEQLKDAYETLKKEQVDPTFKQLKNKYGARYLESIPVTQDYRVDTDRMTEDQMIELYERMDMQDLNKLLGIARFYSKYGRIRFRDARELYNRTVGEIEARSQEERGGPQQPFYRDAIAVEDYVDMETGAVRYSFMGTDPVTGRSVYMSNHPTGETNEKKIEHIVRLVQDVFSKNPIPMTVIEGGKSRTILAQFDPDYDETNTRKTDLGKLTHPEFNATRKRVILNLADDYQLIMREASYAESRPETGKPGETHRGVHTWHYFIDDVYFVDQESDIAEPYRMTISIKERMDGAFVYQFTAKRLENEEDKNLGQMGISPVNTTANGGEMVQASTGSVTQNQQGNNGQNGQNGQTRNSISDAEYMDAVNRGDMETAARMVEEAAKKAGYTIRAVHGTDAERFNTFRQGERGEIWFASTEGTALRGKRTYYDTFLRMRNPYEMTAYIGVEAQFDPTQAAEAGRSNGHDGTIVHFRLDSEGVDKNISLLKKVFPNMPATDPFADSFVFMPRGEARAAMAKPGETLTEFMERGRDEDLYQWYTVYNPAQIKSADPVTYDEQGKVIPLSQRFNREKDDIRFSMSEPVERVRDLVAMHNVDEDGLDFALEIGGFASPSTAVVKSGQGHNMYGPISVVFRSDTIDPQQDRQNRLYGTDAWTPTKSAARLETELKSEGMAAAMERTTELIAGLDKHIQEKLRGWFNQRYMDYTAESVEDMERDAWENYGWLAAYQRSRGREVLPEMREETLTDTELGYRRDLAEKYRAFLEMLERDGTLDAFMSDFRSDDEAQLDMYARKLAEVSDSYRRLYEKMSNPDGTVKKAIQRLLNGARAFEQDGRGRSLNRTSSEFDGYKTKNTLQKAIDRSEFRTWFRKEMSGAFGMRGIRNNRELYTNNGRRTFRQTHDQATLENIVKAMNRAEEKGGFAGSASGLMAMVSKEYKTLDQMREDSERLQHLEQSEYQQLTDALQDRISTFIQGAMTSEADLYNVREIVADAARAYAKSGKLNSIRTAFQRAGRNLTTEQVRELGEIFRDAQEIPTGYFEAKPRRAVGLDEVAFVLMPSGAAYQALADKARAAGMTVYTYDGDTYGEDGQRTKALNEALDEMGNVRFSIEGFEPMSSTQIHHIQQRGDVVVDTVEQMMEEIHKARSTKEKKGIHIGRISREILDQIEKETGEEGLFKGSEYTFGILYDDIRHFDKHFRSDRDLFWAMVDLYKMFSDHDSAEVVREDDEVRLVLIKGDKSMTVRGVSLLSKGRRSAMLKTFHLIEGEMKNWRDLNRAVAPSMRRHSRGDSASNGTVAQNQTGDNGQTGQNDHASLSLDGIDETDPAMQQLMQENEQFRTLTAQMAAELNRQELRNNAHLTSKANLTRIARYLRDNWKVKLPIGNMSENLGKIFTALTQARTVAEAQAAMQALGDFARDALYNAEVTDSTDADLYKEVRSWIRMVHTSVDVLKDVYGDMASYRRSGFGTIRLNRAGETSNVDQIYQEMLATLGNVMREDLVNDADQLAEMLRVLDSLAPRVYNPYEEGETAAHGSVLEVASRDLAMRLLQNFAEGGRDTQVLDGLTEPRMDRLAQLLDRAEVVVQDSNETLTVAGYQGMTSREHTRAIERMRQQIRQADTNMEQARQEISRMHQQLIESREQLAQKERTAEILRGQLKHAQGQMTKQQKAELEQKVKDAENQVKTAQQRIAVLEQRLKDQGTTLRQRVKDAVRREHDRMKGISQAERDRRNATELRNKTEREILRRKGSLLKKLNNPSRNGWIPLDMEEAVIALLQAVDTEGAISGTANTPLSAAMLQKAKAAYENINKVDQNGNPGPMAAYYNGDLSLAFDELSQTADGKRVRDLTQHELELLRDIVAGYAAAVINEDRIFTQQRSDSLRAMGGEMIQQTKDRIQTRGEEKVMGPLANWLSQATDRGLLKPVTVFERFNGTVLGEIWKNALRPAEWQHIRNIQKAEAFLNNALDTYHQHESLDADGSRKQKRTAFTLSSGRTIHLTDQELMTLYAWQKREKLVETNHLLGGGVKLANPQRGDTLEEYRLTPGDLQQFNAALTDEQKAFVDHMVQFLSTTVGEWGNAVTRELYGIEKFRETYYLPFTVARSYVAQQPATQQDQRIKTASFTKALTDKATVTLELRGFTELWASHVEQMSDFNAFTLPMEDIVRLMNYKEGAYDDAGEFIGQGDNVRPLMERAWGSNTVGYIHDFLSRLNGNSRNEAGGSWLNTMMGRAKGAAVTWNISVAFQQAGAGIRALAEMDPRDVLPAIATGIGQNGGFWRNYEELQKYAPIAVEKAWGYFDTNMNRGMYQRAQNTFRNRLDDAGGWLAARGDELNWSQIWAACKHEIRRLNPNMTEEEVKQHAAERFVEVIDRTQVVDSIFQRSAFATEKGMMRGLMSFMSEPVTMYNMVVRAVDQYRDAFRTKDATARRAARTKAIRTACSITMSAALTAFLKSLATGLRDRNPEKKDEEGNIIGSPSYMDKVLDAWWPNFLENLAGITTIFGNLYDNAVSNYGNGDLTTAWISNLYNAGKEILKGADADWDKVAYRSTQALSNLTGIGFAGLYRDAKAIFMTVKELMDPESLSGTAWDKSKPWDVRLRAAERNYSYNKQKGKDYYNGMLLEEYMAHGFSEDFQKIADSAIRMGANESTLKSGFQTKLKKVEPRIQQAAQALKDGDMETYERLMGEITGSGIGMKTASSLVNTAYNALVKPEEEPKDPGTGAGLVEALQAEGSSTTAPAKSAGDDLLTDKATQEDVQRAVQMYKAAGMTQEKIADKVSGKYKKPYILATIKGDKTESSRIGDNLKAGGITKDQMKNWTTEGVFSNAQDYGLYWMIKEGRTDDAKATVLYLNANYPGGQTKVKERVLNWAKGLKTGSYDYATVKNVLLAIGISESNINKYLKK